MLATLAEELPHGEDWAFEVKFDGYRALAYVRGGDCTLALAERQRPDRALRGGRARRSSKAVKSAERRPRRRGLPDRRDRARRASRSCSKAPARSSSTRSTCSSSTASRCVDLPLRERKAQLRELLDARVNDRRASRRASTTATRCSRPPRSRASRGWSPSALDSVYKAGQAHARLAEGQDREQRGVRRRRLHARRAAAAPARSARSCSPSTRAASCGTSATSARASTTPRSDKLLQAARAAAPRRRRRSPVEPKLPRVRKGDVQWVEPRLVAQVRFGEWTHDGHLRHPAYLGHPRRQERRRGAARRSRCPTCSASGKRELRLSNLDKPFWPDEGITKGDLLRYYQAVAPVLVPHLRGPAVHDAPLSRRRLRQGVLPEGRAVAHAGLDPDAIRALVSTRDEARAKKWVDFPVVERRARAALDGEHGLHRHEHVVLAGRQARPAGLRALRPRSDARGAVDADGRGRADPQGAARRARARVVPEDVSGGKGFHVLVPLDRRSTYEDTRAFAEHRRRRDRAHAPEARDDRVVEGAPPRRPDRREPERRGQDDRVGLLGAAAGRTRPCRRRSPGTR